MKSIQLATMVLAFLLGSAVLARAATPVLPGAMLAQHLRTPARRFALVVGSNATLDAGQAPLRFADDDAARMAELLEEVGVDVELVTTLDRDSQATHQALVGRAHPPTPTGLEAAWDALRGRMEAAQEQGSEVELVIFYSGHGDVGPDGQGYLTLQGGKITRNDLFGRILEQSPAHHNHLLIDACRSEQFVLARGKDWKPDRRAADASADVRRYLDRTHLGAFPNTGVVLAHSADQQTHEWERYRGGIFSHELRSGLRGGADLNGDGRIEYSELGAFVSAANSGVDDPRARLQVVVRPPADDERHPLIVHRDLASRRVLLFTRPDASLYTLEDARGVRVADLRRTTEQPAYLRLPEGEIFVHRETADDPPIHEETRVPAREGGVLLASRLQFEPRQGAARGALDQAFRRGLFTTPFGPGYYAGYTDHNGLLGVVDATWHADAWTDAGPEPSKSIDAPQPDGGSQPVDGDDRAPRASGRRPWWHEGRTWGAVFLGTTITPYDPTGEIRGVPGRVTSNAFRGCLVPREPSGCSALRGFDMRWQVFRTRPGHKYPRTLWYFRTGYGSGYAEFVPEDGMTVEAGEARSLGYLGVPLFLGGNVYVFDNFPVRPYAGLGFGLDVLRLDYAREAEDDFTRVTARIGFELHAGIEARITNHVSLTAEILQLWSARKKLDDLPDFSNGGFTIITGLGVGFGLHEAAR